MNNQFNVLTIAFNVLQESERKAYNPRDFCKVYTMDKQPLNTGEQKDMTEFFTDLITKLEEMSPEMVCGEIIKIYTKITFYCQISEVEESQVISRQSADIACETTPSRM